MKKLLFLFIFLVLLPVISSAETINGHEFEWGGSTDYTMSWANPSVSKGNYIIKVLDFDWLGRVTISVKHGVETQYGVLSQNENTIFDFTKNSTAFQGVKISAGAISIYERVNTSAGPNATTPVNVGTFPCCPQAGISVAISNEIAQKTPKLDLILSPNWDGREGYTSTMNIQIKNTGDREFSEGNVTINISGLKLAKEQEILDQALTYNPSKGIVTRGWTTLFASNSYNINLSVKSPVPPNKSTFTIRVESYFRDSNGKVYSAMKSETVKMLDTMKFEKKITTSSILGEKTYGELDKFFGLGHITVVNIYLTNQQSYAVKSVALNDTIMKYFILRDKTVDPIKNLRLLDNDTKLQWVFDLNASERKEFRYEMSAQRTGAFQIPAAIATWNEWGAVKTQSSDQPTTRVYGVFVIVSKKTDKTSHQLNESLNVITTLENIGDFPAGLNVTDILPKNTTFISGETTYSGFLYPKQSVVLRYNLSADYPGELGFPSPQITFWKKDYEGAYGYIPASNITVFEPSETLADVMPINQAITPTPAQTPLPKSLLDIVGEKAPWLEGAIPIIMLFVAIILMLLLHVINR